MHLLHDDMSKTSFISMHFDINLWRKIEKLYYAKKKVPAILQKKYQLKFTKVPAIADSWWLF